MQKTDNIPNADSETMAAIAAIVKSEVKVAVASELEKRAIATELEEKVTIAEIKNRLWVTVLFSAIAGYGLAKAYLAFA